jgi:hypothetical protein
MLVAKTWLRTWKEENLIRPENMNSQLDWNIDRRKLNRNGNYGNKRMKKKESNPLSTYFNSRSSSVDKCKISSVW